MIRLKSEDRLDHDLTVAWYVAGLPRFKKFPESPEELIKKIKSSARKSKEGPTLGQMRTQLYMLSEYLGKPIRIKKPKNG